MKLIEIPWPHAVIDDYYEPSLFLDMREELISLYKKILATGILEHQKHIKIRNLETLNDPKVHKTQKCVFSNTISEKELLEFPVHRSHKELKWTSEIIIGIRGLNFPIHDETKNKILSVVTYVDPEQSTGTLLYDSNKQYIKTVEWKPNRTLIFPGRDQVTWHNYECKDSDYRISINQFLIYDHDIPQEY